MTSDPLVSQTQVISAARFVIDFINIGRIAFSELEGITSKVDSSPYIFSDATGKTVHTKQFGKTEPPTITLKRGLDAEGNAKLLGWHQLARIGSPDARDDGILTITDAAGNTERQIQYFITEGWCSELQISGVKAGDSAVASITVKITCGEISAAKT